MFGRSHLACPALLSLLSLLLLNLPSFTEAADTGAPISPPAIANTGNVDWTGWGGNVYNNRWVPDSQINSSTLGQLQPHCKIQYPLGVSATPVVLNNTVYYPTSNGSLYALNLGTCQYVWQLDVAKTITDFKPLNEVQITLANTLTMSRTSPQIDVVNGVLYIGTQAQALLIAVGLASGQVLGIIQVHDHPLAIITMSPTLYDGNIFIGVSSQESSATRDTSYPCCNFVGKFSSYRFDVQAQQFVERWHIDTLPLYSGWAGAGVWGSQPSIDPSRNQVFFGTGNTYIYPAEYEHCINETAACLPEGVWQESVFAVDMGSGAINWRQTLSPLDGWVMICGYAGAPTSSSPLCPERPGPDADFGMAPTFIPAALGDGTTGNDTVVIGQKSGNVYSFNAASGAIQWAVVTSPDQGTVGGAGALSWGLAADAARLYFTAINFGAVTWNVQPSGEAINNSAFGAADLRTGRLLWEVPAPAYQLAYTPPAVASDVMFVGPSGSKATSNDEGGQVPGAMTALSVEDGRTLATWPVDSVQRGGVAVSGGFVIWGSGYHYQNPFGFGSLYVLGLEGAIEEARTMPQVAAPVGSHWAASEGEKAPEKSSGAASVVVWGERRGGWSSWSVLAVMMLLFCVV